MKYSTVLIPFLITVIMLAVPHTAALAATTPTTDLSIGSRGESVIWLQQQLINTKTGAASVSLASVGTTGYFGSLTRSALAEYQQAQGITPAAGYFGPKTRAFMASTTASYHVPTFTGTISAVDTGCFADATCSVTVDGKKIILMSGFRIPSLPVVGAVKGVESIGDLQNRIGATADVYATTTSEGGSDYTLYGNTEYYVDVHQDKPAGTPITVTGTITCLPPKNTSGPVIALCAFGIKTDIGTYYGLSDINPDSMLATVESDQRVEISGILRPGVAHSSFKGDGTIEIINLKKI